MPTLHVWGIPLQLKVLKLDPSEQECRTHIIGKNPVDYPQTVQYQHDKILLKAPQKLHTQAPQKLHTQLLRSSTLSSAETPHSLIPLVAGRIRK